MKLTLIHMLSKTKKVLTTYLIVLCSVASLRIILSITWRIGRLSLLYYLCRQLKGGGMEIHMKKDTILWMAASAVVMLAFPWIAVTFVKGDAGMAVCFLLFFAVNPLYSVLIGAFAGKDIRHLWSLPVISAVLFLIGTWIFFDMGETAFILYAAVYLALGIAAMLISMLIRKKTQK